MVEEICVMRAYNSNVSIDGSDPLIASRDQQLAPDQLLDGEYNTIFTPYPDGSSTTFDSLGSIFYLQWNHPRELAKSSYPKK